MIVVPEPCAPLQMEHLYGLLQQHRRAPLSLTRERPALDAQGQQQSDAEGRSLFVVEPYALNEDRAAIVTALLRLSQQTLLVHALATAAPDRPVAEVLSQAVAQLRWS